MVRPTPVAKKPSKAHDAHNIQRPPPPPQAVKRPDRPDTPTPTASSLIHHAIARHRMHSISRGLLHVHKNGLRTRRATCPPNATCLGIDDIGEFMYNQARKCRHLLDELNRRRDPDLPPITDGTPMSEFITGDPAAAQAKVNVVVEIGPPHSGMELTHCWDNLDQEMLSTSNNL